MTRNGGVAATPHKIRRELAVLHAEHLNDDYARATADRTSL